MIFSPNDNDRINLQYEGTIIKQKEKVKQLGIVLDQKLKFHEQANFASQKATKAAYKVLKLIKDDFGIGPKLGVLLFKALVRPHLEYAAPVWCNTAESNIKLIEKVQNMCLRKITGAHATSSIDAIENICGVQPIKVRLKEMCQREYIRLLCSEGPLNKMLNQGIRINATMSPLYYLKHCCKDFTENLKDYTIVKDSTQSSLQILDDFQVERIHIVKDIGNSNNRSESDKFKGYNLTRNFVCNNVKQHTIVFTDGSVIGEKLNKKGGCSAVFLHPDSIEQSIVYRKSLGFCLDNVSSELAGIDLAIEGFLNQDYFSQTNSLIICCDCSSAIDIVMNRQKILEHAQILDNIRINLVKMKESNFKLGIAWVPGHANIDPNEKADEFAKIAASENPSNMLSKLTSNDLFKYSKELCKIEWQRRWTLMMSTSGIVNLMTGIRHKTIPLPDYRPTACSYIRLLVNRTNLNVHKKLYGFITSSACECDNDIETREHYISHCQRFTNQRQIMESEISNKWSVLKSIKCNLNINIELLLGQIETQDVDYTFFTLVKEQFWKFLFKTERGA